jgi:lipoprotein-releasing system ATP-binding protein
MAEPVLELHAVVRDFGEHVITRVLHGIDLTLRRGEFAALTGPSGSGKSTLLNLIGLLDRPTSGTIAITGQETTHLDDEQLTRLRGRTLGFIFQFHHLLPAFTALENVVIPALADHGSPDRQMFARAELLLRRVGLDEKLNAKATDLSGGQQQRVAVARSLVMSPPLVLADEPTGNLDTQTANEVFELLRRINCEEGTTFLIVTHDPQLAARCDRTIDLVDGRIRSDRPTLAG